MTTRELYDAVLVEQNKVNFPDFTIEEFNYLLNKTLLAFSNERYNFYNLNQQLSDDLRVLLKTATYSFTTTPWNPTSAKIVSLNYENVPGVYVSSISDLNRSGSTSVAILENGLPRTFTATKQAEPTYPYLISSTVPSFVRVGQTIHVQTPQLTDTAYIDDPTLDRKLELVLPSSDYFHMLSVRTFWKGRKLNGNSSNITIPAKRLTYDMLNTIENNTYLRPKYNRVYFMVQENSDNAGVEGFDIREYRGNQNRPRIDLHVGYETPGFDLVRVEVDYLKRPEMVVLDEIDIFSSGTDGSQVIEFPDYLKNQFVKRITDYMLEIMRDPRIGTHPQLNQEIPQVPLELQQQQAQPRQEQ